MASCDRRIGRSNGGRQFLNGNEESAIVAWEEELPSNRIFLCLLKKQDKDPDSETSVPEYPFIKVKNILKITPTKVLDFWAPYHQYC
uniref:Uncharacterized protein n=1 Tax=Lactuca sativa TaxID=4236 RepID=A0A9R1WCM3_LACSA|nr:hypothetical protein LSAT_V11C200094450 [Lactuca sativa]